MRALGRTLQLAGLVVPLSGIFLAESTLGTQSMTYSFGGLLVGAAIFWIGWKMQGATEG